MSLLRRTRLDEANLLDEARRRQSEFIAAQEAEHAEVVALLAPLYFELEELVAPARIAAFASRPLPILGWLVETDYFPGLNQDLNRKEGARLLAERSSRHPQLAFDAGSAIVLALSWDSGRIARFQRSGGREILTPYGEMTRLEQLASVPSFPGPGRARGLVPRAEAYELFCQSLTVPREERNALAGKLRAAIATARAECASEAAAPSVDVAADAQVADHGIRGPGQGSERGASSQRFEDLGPFDEHALGDDSVLVAPEVEAAAARLASGMQGLLARVRGRLPTASRPPDTRS
jgi:hypothetical protein